MVETITRILARNTDNKLIVEDYQFPSTQCSPSHSQWPHNSNRILLSLFSLTITAYIATRPCTSRIHQPRHHYHSIFPFLSFFCKPSISLVWAQYQGPPLDLCFYQFPSPNLLSSYRVLFRMIYSPY